MSYVATTPIVFWRFAPSLVFASSRDFFFDCEVLFPRRWQPEGHEPEGSREDAKVSKDAKEWAPTDLRQTRLTAAFIGSHMSCGRGM